MPSSTPRVTVIIPVRNCQAFIGEAVDSVLRQAFTDYELLVIDDGSDDWDYRQLEARDPRIRVIRLKGNGVSRARNTGMQQARGEFIAFLDADDVWFPGKLEAQIRYFDQHPTVGVVFGGFIKWRANEQGVFPPSATLERDCSQVTTCEPTRSGWLYTRLLNGLLVGMNTAVIRREVRDAIGGFNEAMRQGEDYDFWIKTSRLVEMHSLDASVALYRIHDASAMHRLPTDNQLVILLKAATMRWGFGGPGDDVMTTEEFQRRLSQVDFEHGYSHFWHGDRRVARQSFWRAFKRGGYMPSRCAAYVALSYLPNPGFFRLR
jgi:glycosyltransferase involved in cell wall biosynthesis